MDDADVRIYKYALLYPQDVRALIPVSFGAPLELQAYGDFNGYSR